MTANSQSDSRNGFLTGSPFYILFPLLSTPLEVSPNPQTHALVLPQRYLPLEQSLHPWEWGLTPGLAMHLGKLVTRRTRPGAGRDQIYQLPHVPAFLPCPAEILPTRLFHYWQDNVLHIIASNGGLNFPILTQAHGGALLQQGRSADIKERKNTGWAFVLFSLSLWAELASHRFGRGVIWVSLDSKSGKPTFMRSATVSISNSQAMLEKQIFF